MSETPKRKRRMPKKHSDLIEERRERGHRMPGGPKPDNAAPRLMKLVLLTNHSVNGVSYGPGEVIVEEGLAAFLLEQEQRAAAEEASFYGKRAVIVGPRRQGMTAHRLHDVPYETFDDSILSAAPIVPKPNPVG